MNKIPSGPEVLKDLQADVIDVTNAAMADVELTNPKPIATINGYHLYPMPEGLILQRGPNKIAITLGQKTDQIEVVVNGGVTALTFNL